jgi:hypothetical protein
MRFLVVTRIADDRDVSGRVARQVFEQPTGLDLELDPIAGLVELRGIGRPPAID